MGKRNYKIVLDEVIEEAVLKLPLSNVHKNNARRFLHILLKDGERENGDRFSFTDKPYLYLSKVFRNTYYKDFLKTIIEEGIVEVNESYSSDLHFCKKYRVSEKLAKMVISTCNQVDIMEDVVGEDSGLLHNVLRFSQLPNYQTIRNNKIDLNVKIKQKLSNMDIEKDFDKCASQLYVNFPKLESVIEKYVNGILPNSFNINYAVKRKVIPIQKDDGSTLYLSKTQALNYTRKRNVDIIEDFNGRIIIEDLFKFIVNKRHSVTESYLESLINLSEKNFYAERNSTNNRLDTNLTNFPSLLLEVIKEDNGLVEIDLCNSQFAIFAHLIPEDVVGGDVELFKTLSQECELYPYLQEKMALSSRKEAKIVCFEICFSSHKNHSQYVTEMRKLFPNVMRWVDDFKKQNGDNQFAIMLQKKEAEIFIDNLYPMIREQDIFCLTKHDSLIVKAEDEYKVRNIIEEYFEEINFKATIR